MGIDLALDVGRQDIGIFICELCADMPAGDIARYKSRCDAPDRSPNDKADDRHVVTGGVSGMYVGTETAKRAYADTCNAVNLGPHWGKGRKTGSKNRIVVEVAKGIEFLTAPGSHINLAPFCSMPYHRHVGRDMQPCLIDIFA